MKLISAAAGLLLCLTILTSCGVSSASSVDGTTASVSGSASVTAVTDAQTTASAAAAGTQAQTAASTAAAGSTAAQTESTAPAQDSTASGSESAASSAQSSVQTSAATSATEQQQSSARNLFDEIRPGMDCTAYITANKGYTLQKDASCMGEGEDRVYTYSDYKIISYFENGKDIIQEIVLTGKGVAARSGLKVGMTTDDIERVFGVPAVPGEYIYPSGNGYIDFLLEADNQTIRLISFYTEEEPE